MDWRRGPVPHEFMGWFWRRRGILRDIVLYILAFKGELTGAQIIDEIERWSFGFWRPSPGSIYPLLDDLEREGLIKISRIDGVKKYYSLTEEGKKAVGVIGGVNPPPPYLSPFSVDEFVSMARYIIDNWDRLPREDREKIRQVLNDLSKAVEH
ncbi:MAG: PadR family transcriptional regulator [Caldivirga sp.]|jgi:DNA-binding PadR family transcriptional regulator|uniref:PadR family transcriptional regulator n=1 Tax=Caldivirga sp. MU80 TaxID=1650354 RepID=UPI000ACA4C39|nr:PadR family transcriptional regulator [Caldivirga sp. MU80]